MSFHSLYGLSGHLILCGLARFALVFVFALKMAKTAKRAITQTFQSFKIGYFAIPEGAVTKIGVSVVVNEIFIVSITRVDTPWISY